MATCPTCRKRYPDDVQVCEADGDTLLPNAAFAGVDVELSPGQTVGEYRIEGKLGEGGFGAVYRAVHPLIGKAAAVKVLNRQYSSNPQMVSRFIAEARAVNQIRHRNIIDIFAFGALDDGRQYFIMELLDGQPLDGFLNKKGRLSVEEAVAILRPIARALDAAHAAGIAHRDLKPENIFLSFDDDGAPFPKLLDFGIAKLLTPEAQPGSGGQSAKTRTGTPMGTPYYMSPEQCRGKNVDHRTDVYSFGIMLHQVLAGRLPFDGDDLMDLLIKQSTAAAPPLSSMAPHLTTGLDAPILAMLEKEPDKRPQSVGAAMDAFIRAAQAAGFGVQLGPAGNAAQAALVVPATSSANLTPSEKVSIGEAKTVTPALQTFQGAGLDVGAAQKRKMTGAVLVIAPAALLVGAAVVFFATRMSAPAPEKTRREVISPLPPASSTAPGAIPDLVPTAPLPTEVLVTVHTTPKHAAIFLDDVRIGVAPGPVKIKRGAEKVKLTLKADGFAATEVEVEPTENVTVSAKLTKLGGHGPQVKKGYENPF